MRANTLCRLIVLVGLLLSLMPMEKPAPVTAQRQIPARNGDEAEVYAEVGIRAKDLEMVGQIGGSVGSIAVQGKYAYVGIGPRLGVLDVSDPSKPKLVGQSEPFARDLVMLVVQGNHAYASTDYTTIQILSVADPTRPFALGSYTSPEAAHGRAFWGAAMAVVGGYLYLAVENRMRIVAVTDPTRPAEVGSMDLLTQYGEFNMASAGKYIYLTTCERGLLIFDIANQANPLLVGSFGKSGCTGDLKVAGGNAYTIESTGLRIVDISNPKAPVEVGQYAAQEGLHLSVANKYAYVSLPRGVDLVDISNPKTPKKVGFFAFPRAASELASAGKYLYLADLVAGLSIVDVSNPAQPVEKSRYASMTRVSKVAIAGSVALVTGYLTGLRVIDLASPSLPVEIGSYETLGTVNDMVVAGKYAYLATSDGLTVVDVNDGRRLIVTGAYATEQGRSVVMAGSFAYLASSNTLEIIDVSKPQNPTQVGSIDIPGITGIAVARNYVFVANSTIDRNNPGGLQVVRVEDPSHPTLVGSYRPLAAGGHGVAVSGKYVYLGIVMGMVVIDVSDPSHPVEVGLLKDLTPIYAITATDGYAFVACGVNGLWVVDVSNPIVPRRASSLYAHFEATRVAIVGNRIFVAGGYGGLWILRFTGGRDWDMPSGHFFTQTRGDTAIEDGYAVVDDAVAPFWSEFRRLGGVNAVGYPISRRFVWNGFVSQAFQKAILQWHPDAQQVNFVNIFDEFSKRGMDSLLVAYKSTPPNANFGEANHTWEEIVESRMHLLDGYPELREAYLSVGDWLNLNGLPTALVADYGNVRVLRAQRVVIQQWMVDTPWATAGQVVIANGGDLAKEWRLFPESDREPESWSAYEPIH